MFLVRRPRIWNLQTKIQDLRKNSCNSPAAGTATERDFLHLNITKVHFFSRSYIPFSYMPYFSPFKDDQSKKKKAAHIHMPTTITISLWGLTRNAARMILVTFSLTDSWRMSDRTGMILYRRRCSHIWGLNARSHIEKIIWYWSWKPHLLLKTPIMLKKNRGGGKKVFHTSTSKKWNMLTLKEQVSELYSASSLAVTALS